MGVLGLEVRRGGGTLVLSRCRLELRKSFFCKLKGVGGGERQVLSTNQHNTRTEVAAAATTATACHYTQKYEPHWVIE